jgi:acetyltransferase-like isoleucine patch superfamily enzyme
VSDPRQARFLTWASLRWIVRHRAWTPWYLVRYWRFFWFRLRSPHIVTEGFVFLGRGARLFARKDHARMIVGAWVHVGDRTAIRAHEGTLRIGEKVVFGGGDTVNCYLDIEIGATTLIADSVYICDFDHVTEDITVPIKDQGIVKSSVRIGPDVWMGTKVTVLRGSRIGRGSVLAANCVARGRIPAYSVAAGLPARVVRSRLKPRDEDGG